MDDFFTHPHAPLCNLIPAFAVHYGYLTSIGTARLNSAITAAQLTFSQLHGKAAAYQVGLPKMT